MDQTRTNFLFSAVKGLIVSAISGAVLIAPFVAAAQPPATTPSAQQVLVVNNNEDRCATGEERICIRDAETKKLTCHCEPKACSDNESRLTVVGKEVTNACAKAGFGGLKECNERNSKCVRDSKTTDDDKQYEDQLALALAFPTENSLLSTLQNSFRTMKQNQNLNKTQGCPDRPARDYFEDHGKLKDKISAQQDKIKEIQEAMTKEQQEFNKAQDEVQEELRKQQEQVNRDKRDINDDLQKTIKDANKNQQEAQTQIAEINGKSSQLRMELSRLSAQEAEALINLSKNWVDLTCSAEVEALRKEYIEKYFNRGLDSFTSGKEFSDRLRRKWLDCTADKRMKRQNLQAEFRMKRAEIIRQINANDQNIGSINDSLRAAGHQLTQAQQQSQVQASQSDQNLLQAMQNNNLKLQKLAASVQSKQLAQRGRLEAIQKELDNHNRDLEKMGPAPNRGVTGTFHEVEKAFADYAHEALGFQASCCSKDRYAGKHPICVLAEKETLDAEKVREALIQGPSKDSNRNRRNRNNDTGRD